MKSKNDIEEEVVGFNNVSEPFALDLESVIHPLKELVFADFTPKKYTETYNYYNYMKARSVQKNEYSAVGKWLIASGISSPCREDNGSGQLIEPLKNSEDLTLRILIRENMGGYCNRYNLMREVKVPANYSFQRLHDVINVLCNIKDVYKWKFLPKIGRRYYNAFDAIALPGEAYSNGLRKWSTNAIKAEISGYLLDKEEYAYVIETGRTRVERLTVSLLEVIENPCSKPTLLDWEKSCNIALLFPGDQYDTAQEFCRVCKLPRKESLRIQLAAELGYADWHELDQLLDTARLDPDAAQCLLDKMPGPKQMKEIWENMKSEETPFYEKIEPEPFFNVNEHTSSIYTLAEVLKSGYSSDEYSDFYKYCKELKDELRLGKEAVGVGQWLYMAQMNYSYKVLNGHGKIYEPLDIKECKAMRLTVTWESKTQALKNKVWREVDVPWYTTFSQLHEVINVLFDIDEGYRWNFVGWKSNRVYGDVISLPDNGCPRWNVDARRAVISGFLSRQSYIYRVRVCDSDRIYSVSLKNTLTSPCRHPQIGSWRGPLNLTTSFDGERYAAIAEFVGLYKLPDMDKEKNRLTRMMGFDNWRELVPIVEARLFVPEYVQKRLEKIL